MADDLSQLRCAYARDTRAIAGVTRPADHWLGRLKNGGRLVAPLTASGHHPAGAVFCFTRHGDDFQGRAVSPTVFIPCEGMRDQDSADALAAAFAKGGVDEVTRLVRGSPPPEEACGFAAMAGVFVIRHSALHHDYRYIFSPHAARLAMPRRNQLRRETVDP